MARPLPLGVFLSALIERLAAMPTDELRSAVIDFASSLPPRERQPFLEQFGAPPPKPGDETAALLADLEVLEEEAAATGEPEWGELDEWHDRYGFGLDDETVEPDWGPALADLLAAAGDLFLGGHTATAVEAFRRLFRVAGNAVADGWWLGLDDDLAVEAAARYLRSTWAQAKDGAEAEALGLALIEVSTVVRPASLSLDAASAAAPIPLRELGRFVTDWIAALERLAASPENGGWAHELLLDAVASTTGIDGLLALARQGGVRAGDAWLAAVDQARREGDMGAAARAAAEGLSAIGRGPQRAVLAERKAVLAANAGDDEGALEGWLEAWRSAPTRDRLLCTLHASRQNQTDAHTVAVLADESDGLPDATRAVLLSLAGEFDAALKVASAKPANPSRRGWAPAGTDAAPVAVPVALGAGADAANAERFADTVLAGLLGGVDRVLGLGDWHRDLGGHERDSPPLPSHGLTLAELLTDELRQHELPDGARRKLLNQGTRLASSAIDLIVGPKDRRRYNVAATYAIAVAEATALTAGSEAGDSAADRFAAQYPRHTAYRHELDEARRRSPLLSNPPRRR